MFDQVTTILKQQHILFHQNAGVTIATVENTNEGFHLVKTLLYTVIDPKTVLYLSGGSTPKVLYEQFAKDEKLVPGAVGMVDERFGKKLHEKSNEKMFGETGFLRYLQMRDIPFYPMLTDTSREQTADAYDQKLRELNATYHQSVAILGIGTDGHTSSMAPNRPDFTNLMFAEKYKVVSDFDDPRSFYGERVGMTFVGLAMIDLLVVLVFGPDKKEPLKSLFAEGKEEEIPARFFKRTEIAKKTLFITDQRI